MSFNQIMDMLPLILFSVSGLSLVLFVVSRMANRRKERQGKLSSITPGARAMPAGVRKEPEKKSATAKTGAQPADKQQRIAEIVRQAADMGASDIHLSVNPSGLVGWEASARVHGDIIPLHQRAGERYVEEGHQICAAAFNICDMAESTYHEHSPQQASLVPHKTAVADLFPTNIDTLRLQFVPLPPHGRMVVMRLVRRHEAEAASNVEDLGYSPENLHLLARLRESAEGIVLFVGPVNSGKSTALQRNLTRYLEETHYGRAVTTLEDPIEFPIPGAKQIGIANVADEEERRRVFASYLRAMLRLDPDLMMLQEIRDKPVATIAFEAAKVGRAIWSTLHANNALAVFSRLRDWVHMDDLFSPEIMRGIVAQRLVQKLCPVCSLSLEDAYREAGKGIKGLSITQERVDIIQAEYEFLEDKSGVRVRGTTEGCDSPDCIGGLSGRALVAEVLKPDERFMELMLNAVETPYPWKIEARRHWVEHCGGLPMAEQAHSHIQAGFVDPRDAERMVEGVGRKRVIIEEAAMDEKQQAAG